MAKKTIHQIPQTVREQLIGLALLRGRLREMVVAVERRENDLISELIGVKLDGGLLIDLIEEHNANVARLAARKGGQA